MLRTLAVGLLAMSAMAQDSPVIRGGTRLVEVDVVVRDKKGPVAGLTKADFTVQDAGKTRPIDTFSVTVAPKPGSNSAPGAPARPIDQPPVATVLLIDRLNTPVESQLFANQRIIRFLQNRQSKNPLGIYTLGRELQIAIPLTTNSELIDRAAKGLRVQDGRRSTAETPVAATGDAISDRMAANAISELQEFIVQDRAESTRDALIEIARNLKNIPGRKNLVWVSASFPILIVRAGKTLNFSDEVNKAAQALTDANVAVYPVDARGLGGSAIPRAEQTGQPQGSCLKTGEPCLPPPDRSASEGIDTMNTLADLTGGRAYYNTNGIEDSIQRATDDAEITYTLGFYPPDGAFDGTFHKLNVKVAGKGREVRSRRGYYATKK